MSPDIASFPPPSCCAKPGMGNAAARIVSNTTAADNRRIREVVVFMAVKVTRIERVRPENDDPYLTSNLKCKAGILLPGCSSAYVNCGCRYSRCGSVAGP